MRAGRALFETGLLRSATMLQAVLLLLLLSRAAAATDVEIVVHRNGEVRPCGTVPATTVLQPVWTDYDKTHDKFDVESRLTGQMMEALDEQNADGSIPACGSVDNATAMAAGLQGYCDMGPERTVVLLDHHKLRRIPFTNTLPCRWFTREGRRIVKFEQLHEMVEKERVKRSETRSVARQSCPGTTDTPGSVCENTAAAATSDVTDSDAAVGIDTGDAEPLQIHLYAVPAGRVFMFAPSYVGEVFELDHLTEPNPSPDQDKVTLEVLSLDPRVFDVKGVFSYDEAQHLVERSLKEQSPSHRLKRSTTGTGQKHVNQKRTSESGFDTHGTVALGIKRRIVEALGMDEFWAGHDDGLQILRYNKTTAYTPHMDYMSDPGKRTPYNFDSSTTGGNRFATVLLYMSDLEDEDSGGELVFSHAWPPAKDGEGQPQRKLLKDAIAELRATGHADEAGIERGSWEEEMVATCRSRFSIKPRQGRAVLFYSQHPNGQQDHMSRHGGCPVLKGEKWAANLWVWSAPRGDFPGQPLRQDRQAQELHKQQRTQDAESVHVTFRNTRKDPRFQTADLYYDEAQFFGKLGFYDPPVRVNSFEGHRWNVRVDGKILQNFVVGSDDQQVFEV